MAIAGPKPLPLIVFFKLNTDVSAYLTINGILPELRKLGYSELCVEQPAEFNQTQILQCLDQMREVANTLAQNVQRDKSSPDLRDELFGMPFLALQNYLQKISPIQYQQMAEVLDTYPSYTALKGSLTTWTKQGGSLHGLWPTVSAFKPSLSSIEDVMAVIDETNKGFNKAPMVAERVLKQYQSHPGTVVILNAMVHFDALLQLKEKLSDQCIFVFPHSSQYRRFPVATLFEIMECNFSRMDLERTIGSGDDIEALKNKMRELIIEKQARPVPVFTPRYHFGVAQASSAQHFQETSLEIKADENLTISPLHPPL
jgi:hypothetical protein